MKTFMKVALAMLVFVIGATLGVAYFSSGSLEEILMASKTEAETFAKDANKEQCLEAYVDKYKACSELSCYSYSASFGVICLAESQGDSAAFCRDKPASREEYYQHEWKDGLCKDKGLASDDCLNIYKVVALHCDNLNAE